MARRAPWFSTSAQWYQAKVRFPGTGPLPQAWEREVASSAVYGRMSEKIGGAMQIANTGQRHGPRRNGTRTPPFPLTVVKRPRRRRRCCRRKRLAVTARSGKAYAAARLGRDGYWKNR